MDSLEKYRRYVLHEIASHVPFIIESGQGATVRASDGKEYLDAFAGISVTNAGHGNREILDAAAAQMQKVLHTNVYLFPHAPAADLAELLSQISPGNPDKTFFGNSGAEANETAMRLAKQHAGRSEFLALHGSFHGRTNATLSVSGLSARKRGGGPFLPGIAFVPAPYCYRCDLRLQPERCGLACADMVDDAITCATADNVAAMIIEPVMGEGGIVVPPAGYFKRVKAILEKRGCLMIVDEVQTGFGRTGHLFAIEAEGVTPDIMTMGKGIANGFPLSAMIAPARIASAFKPGDHLSTFGGNPVCCAAAIATIRFHQREKLAEQSGRKGEWLLAELRRKLANHPRVGEVRGRGLMIGIELVSDLKTRAPAPDLARKSITACRERGVLIGSGGVFGNVLRLQPPLVISDSEIARLAETVVAAL